MKRTGWLIGRSLRFLCSDIPSGINGLGLFFKSKWVEFWTGIKNHVININGK